MKDLVNNWKYRELGDQRDRNEFASELKEAIGTMCARIGFKPVRFLRAKNSDSFTSVVKDTESGQLFTVTITNVGEATEWFNHATFRSVDTCDYCGGALNVCRLTSLEGELKKAARMYRAA